MYYLNISFVINFGPATGKLFWPKSTNLRYVGRFRGGMMNGRGTEFDEHGAPIYQGTFRNNLRDGKGQETSEGKLSYSGDFKVRLQRILCILREQSHEVY